MKKFEYFKNEFLKLMDDYIDAEMAPYLDTSKRAVKSDVRMFINEAVQETQQEIKARSINNDDNNDNIRAAFDKMFKE